VHPVILFAALSSTSLSLPPATGQAATVTISRPGTIASMPKRASPQTLTRLSSRLERLAD
jgi:hypothetical protein